MLMAARSPFSAMARYFLLGETASAVMHSDSADAEMKR